MTTAANLKTFASRPLVAGAHRRNALALVARRASYGPKATATCRAQPFGAEGSYVVTVRDGLGCDYWRVDAANCIITATPDWAA